MRCCILMVVLLTSTRWGLAENRIYVSLMEEHQISLYRQHAETGQLAMQSQITLDGEPGALALSPDGRQLFASIRSLGKLASFQVARNTGNLSLISEVSAGADPAFVATDQTGAYLLSAYYRAGKITVHQIADDGTLSAEPHQTISTAEKAHAILTDPTNRFAFVPHTGPNAIYQFQFNAETGLLAENSIPIVHTGENTGPRHLAFHPARNVVYLDNEQGSSVTAYRLNTDTGRLKPLQTLSTLPGGLQKSNSCARLQIHPTGRYVYASNRGHDSIAGFAIDPATGHLSSLGQTPTEQTPRGFDITPDGNYLVAAGQSSGRLAVYRINADTGHLARFQTLDVGDRPWWVLATDGNQD